MEVSLCSNLPQRWKPGNGAGGRTDEETAPKAKDAQQMQIEQLRAGAKQTFLDLLPADQQFGDADIKTYRMKCWPSSNEAGTGRQPW